MKKLWLILSFFVLSVVINSSHAPIYDTNVVVSKNDTIVNVNKNKVYLTVGSDTVATYSLNEYIQKIKSIKDRNPRIKKLEELNRRVAE